MDANSREGSGSEILILASIGVIRGYTLFPFAVERPEKSQKAGRSEFLPSFCSSCASSRPFQIRSCLLRFRWSRLDFPGFRPLPPPATASTEQCPPTPLCGPSSFVSFAPWISRLRAAAGQSFGCHPFTHSPIHPFTCHPSIFVRRKPRACDCGRIRLAMTGACLQNS